MGCVFTRRAYKRDVNISVVDKIVTFRVKTTTASDKARAPAKLDIIKVSPQRGQGSLTEATLAAHSVETDLFSLKKL
jgi:hypothetical protein